MSSAELSRAKMGLHMLQPPALIGSHSRNRDFEQHANIVRVPAKDAPPIVGSVPKCRSSRGASRADKQRVAGIRAAERALEPDRVLLIVNDDHINGGGVPIIGRRLPSKSSAARSASHQHESEMQLPVGSVPLDYPDHVSAPAPVVGRRSHRMIQQQQQQQRGAIYQYECYEGAHGQLEYPNSLMPMPSNASSSRSSKTRVSSSSSSSSLEQHHQHQKQQQQQYKQPLSIVETHLATSKQIHLLGQQPKLAANPKQRLSSGSKQKQQPVKYQSVSMINSAELLMDDSYAVQMPMETALKGADCFAQANQYSRNSKSHNQHQHQIACSNLCAGTHSQVEPLYLPDPYPACCSPCPKSPELSTAMPELSYSYAPEQAVCNSLARSSSCQRVPSCCIPQQQQVQSKPTGHGHHNPHHHHQQQSSQRQGRSNACHLDHHHQSCRANGSFNNKPPTAYRSSSCHDQRPAQPMLISGRNVLPVHPKPFTYSVANHQREPVLNKAPHTCCQHQQLKPQKQQHHQQQVAVESEETTAVTQMYESLAAELKAKLGDPKMGPILLPPKDYDTMSRKQGKLNGIELRRSTNPMLVGPTANRLNPRGAISEEQVKNEDTNGSLTGSTRSSGRSQDDRSLQRSRSNSSSGLGSISMGPSSPNSPPPSKLSPEEDTRQASRSSQSAGNNYTKVKSTRHHHAQGMSTSPTRLDRKNCSPDNCASSDSGHSGSGRLDSALSSEEQKSMLRDTGDYFKSNEVNCGAKARRSPKSPLEYGGAARTIESIRGKGAYNHNPSKVSDGVLWNGRVELPLKVNSAKNGNTYLATKQIIY